MSEEIKVDLDQIAAVENIPDACVNVYRKIHFLAQCHEETGGFSATSENLNYDTSGLKKYFSKYFQGMSDADIDKYYARKPEKIANRIYARTSLGNGDENSGDGWKYRGRGYIQLTGKYNYEQFQKSSLIKTGDDVVKNPDLVASKYPLESASHYFTNAGVWRYCDKGAGDDVVVMVSAKVNTGNANSPSHKIINLDMRRKCFAAYYKHYTGENPPDAPPSDDSEGAKSEEEESALSYEKTFEEISTNIANAEQDQVPVSWGKKFNETESSDWISLKQFLLHLAITYVPQGILPFVELIPEATMNNDYEKTGKVPDDVKSNSGSKSSEYKDRNKKKKEELDKELGKGDFNTDSARAKKGEETTNKYSGVADLTTIDPFHDTYAQMGFLNEAGAQLVQSRKIGVRAFGQLVLNPGVSFDKASSKPGPVGFQEFEIQSGSQCDNGLALITMKLLDLQGNKFTDLASPWSFIYDARMGAIGGDFWFRYGWMIRLPYYDETNKTSMLFWTHPGWALFTDDERFFLINQILPDKPYITLTQSLNTELSSTVDSKGTQLSTKKMYSLFDDGVQYDESNGTITMSRSNLTESNYVKLAILNPELSMDEGGALIASLSFRTTGSIVHQMPLAFAHNIRRTISESQVLPLGDLMIAYLSDLDSFQSLLDSEEERGKRRFVSNKVKWRDMARSRNFDGYVYITGLGKSKNMNSNTIHPDTISIAVGKKRRQELENKVPDNEMTMIRWFRSVLDDNGCALLSAATGSGAGINAAWVIAVTETFDGERYNPDLYVKPEEKEKNNSDGTQSRDTGSEALSRMVQEKDVFGYRFQGALQSSISIKKSESPNAMKLDVDFTVGDFLTYDDGKVGNEQPPLTTADRQRGLKILFAQMQNANISALCHPWIGPGKFVFVKGMGFFDGEYMVLSATHKLTGSDFTTEIEGARMIREEDNDEETNNQNKSLAQEEGGRQNMSKPVDSQYMSGGAGAGSTF